MQDTQNKIREARFAKQDTCTQMERYAKQDSRMQRYLREEKYTVTRDILEKSPISYSPH